MTIAALRPVAARPHGAPRLLGALLVLLLSAGCGWFGGSISYSVGIIELTVTTDGTVELGLGRSLVTPIGVFRVGADISPPDEEQTLLVLVHDQGGDRVESRFLIDSRAQLAACLDGSFYGEFTEQLVRITALGGASVVRLVDAGGDDSRCRPSTTPTPTPTPDPASPRLGPGDFDEVQVSLNGRSYRMLLADTEERISAGMSGWSADDLEGIDGMLYALPYPRAYDPVANTGFFVFPGYTFDPDVLFFDAGAWLINGAAGRPCARDGSDCPPYYAVAYGYPAPYQFVIESFRGRLTPLPTFVQVSWTS